MSRGKWVTVLAVVVVLAALAVYVWPTPWWYPGGDGGIGMVRVHRFTGRVEMLRPVGWCDAADASDVVAERERVLERQRQRTYSEMLAERVRQRIRQRIMRTIGQIAAVCVVLAAVAAAYARGRRRRWW